MTVLLIMVMSIMITIIYRKGGDLVRVEIRNDSIFVDGYVNAVERDSKRMRDSDGFFVEKIKSGAFKRSLERSKLHGRDVKVLLNHDYAKILGNTFDNAKIFEDNIGLRCQCEIREKEAIDKAKEGKLIGWSFGFIPLKQDKYTVEEKRHRDVYDLDLREVSILDDTKIPAYDGNSICVRDIGDDGYIEIRMINDKADIYDYSDKCNVQNQSNKNTIDDNFSGQINDFRKRFIELV